MKSCIELLESRIAPAALVALVSKSTLVVKGTPTGILDVNQTGDAAFSVYENGSLVGAFTGVHGVKVTTEALADVVNVSLTADGLRAGVQISSGDGEDRVSLSTAGTPFIPKGIKISTGKGNDTVNVDGYFTSAKSFSIAGGADADSLAVDQETYLPPTSISGFSGIHFDNYTSVNGNLTINNASDTLPDTVTFDAGNFGTQKNFTYKGSKGDSSLSFSGRVLGSMSVSLGNGNNTFRIVDGSAVNPILFGIPGAGSLKLRSGGGNDNVTIEQSIFNGKVDIALGGGANTSNLNASFQGTFGPVKAFLNYKGGSGADIVSLYTSPNGAYTPPKVTVNVGSGDNSFALSGASVVAKITAGKSRVDVFSGQGFLALGSKLKGFETVS